MVAADAPATATRSALPLLDYLGRLARARTEATLAPKGLRPRHVVALVLLAETGPTAQQDLAAALRLDPSNLVGLLNQLDANDLVTRRRSPADRRRHIVELTRQGHAVLAEVLDALHHIEVDVLRALDPDQRDTLIDLLQQAIGDVQPCTTADD
jgi:MarR family transcriptional regulator, lower aerobic nicotinate degradation pathway regulator